MKTIIIVISVCLFTLCSCEEQAISRMEVTTPTSQVSTLEGGVKSGGQTLPAPSIIKQTFIPTYSPFSETKCHAWRITWPTYPAGTDPNLIPTVFTTSSGGLNSFHFLNNTSATTTYKTNFNLYNNAKVETANTLWTELKYTFDGLQNMETTRFYKSSYTVKTIEYMVKERPSLFESYFNNVQDVNNLYTEFTYQQGDIFLYKLEKQNRYGGVRIVSMTPRIIEVYLTEPNN